jgi:hypothetical protein
MSIVVICRAAKKAKSEIAIMKSTVLRILYGSYALSKENQIHDLKSMVSSDHILQILLPALA